MVNLRARQYVPGMMRFNQRDVWHGTQIIASTQNRYLYCIDDPINLYDYSGKVIIGKNAGVRLPISKPMVDITKVNPGLKKSVAESISKLSALISIGIDTTGYNDEQKKVIEEAEKRLLEEELNGTLTEEKRKEVIKTACYESFWAGGDDYFNGNWWQDKTKHDEAYQMLLLEAQSTGSLNLIDIDQENATGEINNKMLGFQAIINAARTGVWDEGTLSAIENGLVASGIAGSYEVTADELAILYGREIIGRETGYWLESAGYPEMLSNAALLLLLFDIALDNNLGTNSGQNVENAIGETKNEYTRVGRWMSIDEYNTMKSTGKVQMSSNGVTSVAKPADPSVFSSQAKPGTIYVEFDVPISAVQPGGKETWGLISGPGSLWDRLYQSKGLPAITEMPDAQNIQIAGGK